MRSPAVTVAFLFLFTFSRATLTDDWLEDLIVTEPAYYDCGSWMVYEHLVEELLITNAQSISVLAESFRNVLFDLNPYYRKLVVPEKLFISHSLDPLNQAPTLYVVIDQTSQIVGIITEMRNGHFIKCKRVDESVPEPQHISPDEKYEYHCGPEVFSQETIERTVTTATSNKGKNALYPATYQGKLYKPELNYWIYPVLRGDKGHRIRRIAECIFFVVVSPTGEPIDVIAELRNKDFMKCSREIQVPHVDLDQELREGYLCGIEFFDLNHVKRTVELAKTQKVSHKLKMGYPKVYSPAPYHENLLIFPILPNNRFYGGVTRALKYFVVMDSDFQVNYMAWKKTTTKMIPCEKSTRGLGLIPPETDNFQCNNALFFNKQLLENVKNGCGALGASNKRFPADYDGPPFSIPGPYFTWPIGKKAKNIGSNSLSNYRVVLNVECRLAGVLGKIEPGNPDSLFYKCERFKDKSIPGGESPLPIRERLLPISKDIRKPRKPKNPNKKTSPTSSKV